MAVVYLIGDPVEHSLSPVMQNAAFGALHLPHRYELLRVAAEDLPAAVRRIRDPDVLGANVTIPHKQATRRYVDALDEVAQRVGAVNTLVKRGGTLSGANTDAGGFADALAEAGIRPAGARVLMLGAGGAARACADVFARVGARLVVADRTADRAARLARAGTLPWPVRSVEGFELVVNATSLGMHGEDPLEDVAVPAEVAVADVVATAAQTALVARAKASGCVVVDGLLMLLHQGARAFRLWTGLDAPVEVMRAALPREV